MNLVKCSCSRYPNHTFLLPSTKASHQHIGAAACSRSHHSPVSMHPKEPIGVLLHTHPQNISKSESWCCVKHLGRALLGFWWESLCWQRNGVSFSKEAKYYTWWNPLFWLLPFPRLRHTYEYSGLVTRGEAVCHRKFCIEWNWVLLTNMSLFHCTWLPLMEPKVLAHQCSSRQ